MTKSPDAFRTISEVADWLGVQAHVLRFWESKFTHVKPVKRAGGRRYYRPTDMLLLGGIKTLLHDDGLTIKGVQKILREQGVNHVADKSQALDDLTMAVIESDAAAASPPISDAPIIDTPPEPEIVAPLETEVVAAEEPDSGEAILDTPPPVDAPATEPPNDTASEPEIATSQEELADPVEGPEPDTVAALESEPESLPVFEPEPDPEPVATSEPEPAALDVFEVETDLVTPTMPEPAEPVPAEPVQEVTSSDTPGDAPVSMEEPVAAPPPTLEDTELEAAELAPPALEVETSGDENIATDPAPQAEGDADAEPIPSFIRRPRTTVTPEPEVEAPPAAQEPLSDIEPVLDALETSEPELAPEPDDQEATSEQEDQEIATTGVDLPPVEDDDAAEPTDAPVDLAPLGGEVDPEPEAPAQTLDAMGTGPDVTPDVPTDDAPQSEASPAQIEEPAVAKPRVVEVSLPPAEADIPAKPSALSAVTCVKTLHTTQRDAIKPLLAQLIRVRAGMANAAKDASND